MLRFTVGVLSICAFKDIEPVINHVLLIDRSEIIRNEPLDGTANLEEYFENAIQGREVHHD